MLRDYPLSEDCFYKNERKRIKAAGWLPDGSLLHLFLPGGGSSVQASIIFHNGSRNMPLGSITNIASYQFGKTSTGRGRSFTSRRASFPVTGGGVFPLMIISPQTTSRFGTSAAIADVAMSAMMQTGKNLVIMRCLHRLQDGKRDDRSAHPSAATCWHDTRPSQ